MTASTPAHGTPATSRQTPTIIAWMKATPSTPLATARMVAVDRSANSAPRPPAMIFSKIDRTPRAPDSPKAIMMPATTREPRNCSNPPPILATKPSAAFARLPIFGCMLCTSAGRSVWALVQKACTLSPTSGQFSTPSRGGGTTSVLSWMPLMSPCTESPSEFISAAVGTTATIAPSSTSSVAARPCRPPSLAASHTCIGYRVTARISAQIMRFRNGENTWKHSSTIARINPARMRTSISREAIRSSSSGS